MRDLISRREMLFAALCAGGAWAGMARAGASAAPATPTAATPTAAAPPKVNEKDPLAVALGYVSNAKRVDTKASPAYQPGASCSSCSWYQGKAADPAGGACTFFSGKNVDANGWCRMWNKKQ